MASLGTYVPEEVTVLLAGLIPVEGFAAGTFVYIEKDIMPFTSVKTPDGTMARMYHSDQTYTITLTLHNGSKTNDILTKLWQVDEITQRGKFPLFIKDHSGSDLFFSTTTWVEQLPALAKSGTADTRSWSLRSAQAVINIGGNDEASSLLQDLVNVAASALPAIEGII